MNSSMCMLSHFSRVRLFATPWTGAYQASLSMGFSRKEYWSGLPFPSPMNSRPLNNSGLGEPTQPSLENLHLNCSQPAIHTVLHICIHYSSVATVPHQQMVLKEETEQALSWKQGSILGWTVDFELYAQYLWKRRTNWKTRLPEGRAPRLSFA